jgi:hypothetical protein
MTPSAFVQITVLDELIGSLLDEQPARNTMPTAAPAR